MPVFITWNKDTNDIQHITNTFEYAKKIAEDDQVCGLHYSYFIEEYWMNIDIDKRGGIYGI